MRTAPCFGVAGNPPNFKRSSHKGDTLQVPGWLADTGLDAYEYSASHGVGMTDDRARALGAAASASGIALSVHAPYYINFTSPDSDIIEKSVKHLGDSVRIAGLMDAVVVVIHPGWYKGHTDPGTALDRCLETLSEALPVMETIDRQVLIAPETSGSLSQFGSLEEILALCAPHPRLVPCLDFAHIHARQQGLPFDDAAFDTVFQRVEDALGRDRLEQAHMHYYPVEYGDRGERRHRAFHEPEFGPRPEPFVAALRRWNLNPLVICESRDCQDVDALLMKQRYAECGVRSVECGVQNHEGMGR